MVDSGCFKTKLKKEKRRSDGDQTGKQTKIRRKKKYGRHTSSIFDSKGVGCAKYVTKVVSSRESVYNP